MLNARLRKTGRDDDGRGQYVLEKAGPGRLIDAAVAAVLAYEAAAQIPPKSEPWATAWGSERREPVGLLFGPDGLEP